MSKRSYILSVKEALMEIDEFKQAEITLKIKQLASWIAMREKKYLVRFREIMKSGYSQFELCLLQWMLSSKWLSDRQVSSSWLCK